MKQENYVQETFKECNAGCDLFAGYISSACIQDCCEKYRTKKHSTSNSLEHSKQSKLLKTINFQE